MMPTLSAAAVAIGRSLVLSTLVKVTLCFAIGLLAARLLRRSRASLRHAVVAATFAAVLALPLAIAFGPTVDVPVAATQPQAAVIALPAATGGGPAAAPLRPAVARDVRPGARSGRGPRPAVD